MKPEQPSVVKGFGGSIFLEADEGLVSHPGFAMIGPDPIRDLRTYSADLTISASLSVSRRAQSRVSSCSRCSIKNNG